jgi:hypothetical protein
MNFVEATSKLIRRVTLSDAARELKVTTVDLSRARADRSDRYHRQPPEGWEAVVAKLARTQAAHLRRLVEQMSGEGKGRRGKEAPVARRAVRKRSTKKRRA